jgi:hypothetical protein
MYPEDILQTRRCLDFLKKHFPARTPPTERKSGPTDNYVLHNKKKKETSVFMFSLPG